MGRKSYRTGTSRPETERPVQPSAPARRYTPRAARTAPVKVDFTDETQYIHVRQDLLRIGLLALGLFSSLILLRVVSAALGFLP